MTFCPYILYSPSLDKYYIGETENLEERIELHNVHFFEGSFTSQANDWQIYFSIECETRSIARLIEGHIKKMKSRKYIENLKKYPDISKSLLLKYKT